MTATATQKKPNRKPIQMELVGGKPARQRAWEQVRLHKERFQIYLIARRADADVDTVKTYVQSLEKGGYVVRLNDKRLDYADYQLIRDTGIEAPRLNRDGQPVTQGMGQEAMWRCLRMLGPMDARQLVRHVISSGIELKETTARRYLKALKKAGYLQVIHPCDRHKGKLEVLQLIPRMNSGPRPPQIQRVGVVYDPNWNQVMHADEPEELL